MHRVIPLLALIILACNPFEFEDLRQEAPTRVLPTPADYPVRSFGRVLAAYEGELDGRESSRVVVSGGPDTPYAVYTGLVGDEVRIGEALVRGCNDGNCERGAGAALFGVSHYGERELCAGVTAPDEGVLLLRCEDELSLIRRVEGPMGVRFGASAVTLGNHPFGVAAFGAPLADEGAGAVHILPSGGVPAALPLDGLEGDLSRLGTAIAASSVGGRLLIAAGAPDREGTSRVIVIEVEAASPELAARVVGCVDRAEPGFGEVLALADLDGDGAPELVVGSALDADPETVRVYAGSAMPDACDEAWPVARELSCPELEGVGCEGFGAVLATGDLDGDGVHDLLASAPEATVDGQTNAGAVYAFAGGSDLGGRRSVLRHSEPQVDSFLGTSLATFRGLDGRHEVVAGAPQRNRVYVFLCSGLSGDSPETTDAPLCQPR